MWVGSEGPWPPFFHCALGYLLRGRINGRQRMNTEGKEEKPLVICQPCLAHLPGGIKHIAMLEALKQKATLSKFYTSSLF